MKSVDIQVRELGSQWPPPGHKPGRFAGPRRRMRVPIRVQLTTLLLLSSLIGLAVISIAVWVVTHDFVLSVRASRLSLTASLKAAQLASNLNLMQTSANFVSTRVLVQRALMRYNYNSNNTFENWSAAQADLQAAIGGDGSLGQTLLLQSMVFPRDASGPAGPYGLLNTTAPGSPSTIVLPYKYPNGTNILLGANDTDAGSFGFPPPLYPNLTYIEEPFNSTFSLSGASYKGDTLGTTSTLLLGPWPVNSTLSLVSLTVPVVNNTSNADIVGWLTLLMDATLIEDVTNAQEGLDETGETLVLTPATGTNRLPQNSTDSAQARLFSNLKVDFITPLNASDSTRHPDHVQGSPNQPFMASQYPAILAGLDAASNKKLLPSGSMIKALNEDNQKVSVGWAVPQTNIVDWIVLVEQSREEVWAPINHLRDIILACLFATVGFMAVISFPLAHFASLPILRLREATARSIAPPGSRSRSSLGSFVTENGVNADGVADVPVADDSVPPAKKGLVTHKVLRPIGRWGRKFEIDSHARREERMKREFRIPGKVKERKYWIADELSELTETFNEMSDELMSQYTRLDQRVQERTAELEKSKEAAEAANESKTLFIANISHELKTPLNGILGMAAVCMQEDDDVKLKRSLGIIYKSGDLLLNLLNDLLTFTKNQSGQQLTLDEKEFRLRDVSSQILAIFDKQAKDSKIDLTVEFEGIPVSAGDNTLAERTENGPLGTGRIRDMILWGDLHRILQVVINLVSNSLKFSPAGGKVTLVIRCLPEVPAQGTSRAGSTNSKQSRRGTSRRKHQSGSETTIGSARAHVPSAQNAWERPPLLAHSGAVERTASPPPSRFLNFEFEVADTGPGIAESQQEKIFEPFVQGDLGLSRRYGGTGLGLSICLQLAKLMHGTLRLKSTEGHGATFTMKIPIRHMQTRADSSASSTMDMKFDSPSQSRRNSLIDDHTVPTTASDHRGGTEQQPHLGPSTEPHITFKNATLTESMPQDSNPRLVGLRTPFFASSQPMESPGSQPDAMTRITAEAARGGRIRVLVAEDNKVNQEVVLRMLKLEDIYDVTVAQDGQEALDLVKESMRTGLLFNLIFMDIQMPLCDGLQSTRLIREIGYQAPIVALTAFSEESNVKDCYESGMNYFLSKPIKRPMLKKVLKEYCTPIPEEEEIESSPSPDEDVARSNSVNTTSVMVNQTAAASVAPPPSHSEETMSQPSASADDEEGRPVSPRTKARRN